MVTFVKARTSFLFVNGVGGLAVLGSYAYGLLTQVELRGELWGGVPEGLRGLYTVSMLSATVGYFLFTTYFLKLERSRPIFLNRFGFEWIVALYAAMLLPAALWMPMTFSWLQSPSEPLWWAIRSVLLVTGAASVALLVTLARLPGRWDWQRTLAAVGATAFSFQTAVLDATVWTHFFR